MKINRLGVNITALPRLGSRVRIPSPAPFKIQTISMLWGGYETTVKAFLFAFHAVHCTSVHINSGVMFAAPARRQIWPLRLMGRGAQCIL